MVYDVWYMVYGIWDMGYGIWYMVYGMGYGIYLGYVVYSTMAHQLYYANARS